MIVTTPRSTEASSDKDDPKDSTTTTEESMEEAEEMTRLRERLRRRRGMCVYCPRELMTKTVALEKEYGPKDSGTTREALEGDEKYMTRPRYWRQRQKQRGTNDGPKEYTTITEAEEEQDE